MPIPFFSKPDPRHYQIAALSGLLGFGIFSGVLQAAPLRFATILVSALACQALATALRPGVKWEPRSALISGLSLCLLLRTDSLLLALTAAALAIFSKFLIRVRGKHLFNPTNFALAVLLLASDRVWVSPGQWGSTAYFGFLLAGIGGLVLYRAERSDVTYAFLGSYAGLLFLRAAWLGDPWSIPLHQLQSGALLIFAFLMISDPRTTPDSRAGRILFAALVAGGAFVWQFSLFRTNGLILALAVVAVATPLIDRLLPGGRYAWRAANASRRGPKRLPNPTPEPVALPLMTHPVPTMPDIAQRSSIPSVTPRNTKTRRTPMKKPVWLAVLLAVVLSTAGPPAEAFCGFYVAKADTKLFNKASQVAIVRNGDRTVLTMANDFRGDPKEFAMVIPVPTFITKEQIHVADRSLLEHLDAYSSPRLVEYFDGNPCVQYLRKMAARESAAAPSARDEAEAKKLGVAIEAKYTVGEYDILILSAEQSDGLERWLLQNDYKLPKGASKVLSSYIRQGNRFFVAKVNLEQQAELGFNYLRPLQVAFESPKFMLPIRLGTLNADGDQELFVFLLTRKGRVETTNYRTVKLPTGMDLPAYVKSDFGDFYKAMFTQQVEKENGRAVFLEYAWNMSWCDPCAADPLSRDQLRELGVFWLNGSDGRSTGQAQEVFITRLHLRYNSDTFPEDLVFQETGDSSNFQGRYVIRHPWKGDPGSNCPQAQQYFAGLAERSEREAMALANLTGWSIASIRDRLQREGIELGPQSGEPWWRKIWR